MTVYYLEFFQKQVTVEFPREADTTHVLYIHKDELGEEGKKVVWLVCTGGLRTSHEHV